MGGAGRWRDVRWKDESNLRDSGGSGREEEKGEGSHQGERGRSCPGLVGQGDGPLVGGASKDQIDGAEGMVYLWIDCGEREDREKQRGGMSIACH